MWDNPRRVLRRNGEPTILRSLVLAAAVGAAFLIAEDVSHAPARQYVVPPATPAPSASPGSQATNAAADKSIASVEAMPANGVMRDVTLFQREPFSAEGRGLVVVSGNVYKKSTDTSPARSFCYLEAGNLSNAAEVTIRLANKERNGPVVPAPLSDRDAGSVGLPLSALQAAAEKCHLL